MDRMYSYNQIKKTLEKKYLHYVTIFPLPFLRKVFKGSNNYKNLLKISSNFSSIVISVLCVYSYSSSRLSFH